MNGSGVVQLLHHREPVEIGVAKELCQADRLSARWYKRSKDHEEWVETTVAVAESWVNEATARLGSSDPSHMVAGAFFENAIQTLRTIPRRDRPTHNTDQRISELHQRMGESNARAIEEMGVIETEPIDITDSVEAAREAVRGETTIDALRAFASLARPPRVQSLRDNATRLLQEHPIQGLISGSTFSGEGRVVAKRAPMTTSDGFISANDSAIHQQMMLEFSIQTRLVVQGLVVPAHEVLLQEHRISELDLVGLARESPIVPPDRAFLFGKGLFAGYDRDFATSIHLLVPQIENLVRYHLKERLLLICSGIHSAGSS